MPDARQAPSPDAPPTPVGFDDIASAAETIRDLAHRTPIMTSRHIDGLVGASVLFKCENFQRVGAFKFRGACNAMRRLRAAHPDAGVLTYSSGNHAQAIALSGALLGVPTTIVMPSDAPAVKRDATLEYIASSPVAGSEVVIYDRSTTTREELGASLAEERGLTVIPPYDHPDVIAGQGTAAMEFFEDAGPLDALFVPCGGGGMLSGSAIAARAMSPGARIVGVEPAAADDATRSFRTRTLHTVHDPPTIADGARTPSLGRWTFPLVLADVDEMRTVEDTATLAAMRLVWERMKLVIEPTAALGLAGLLGSLAESGGGSLRGKRIGVMLTGGNVDIGRVGSMLAPE